MEEGNRNEKPPMEESRLKQNEMYRVVLYPDGPVSRFCVNNPDWGGLFMSAKTNNEHIQGLPQWPLHGLGTCPIQLQDDGGVYAPGGLDVIKS